MRKNRSEAYELLSPRWVRRPQFVSRTILAIALLACAVEIFRLVLLTGPVLVYLAVAAGVIGLLLLEWAGWLGLIIAGAGTIIAGISHWDPIVQFSVAIFALFLFALRGSHLLIATLITVALTYTGIVVSAGVYFNAEAIAAVSGAIVASALASAIRSQQRYWSALEQRAADAIATRELEATRRVAEERVRIARDLHDVLGHQVAVLSVQLGAIEVSTGPQNEESGRSFAAARSSVQSILQEAQHILKVLREDNTEHVGTLESPSHAMDDIPDLIESFRAIGLSVESTVVERPIGIDDAVEITTYRVVQEALTNAHRYGDGRASVNIRLANGLITIDVSNTLSTKTSERRPTAGYGLVGMRERVTSVGGTLEVQPDGHDFTVHVVLDVLGDPIR